MATNPSQKKRQRELLRQERKREKAVRRAQRRIQHGAAAPATEGEDADLAAIAPGPQVNPEDV